MTKLERILDEVENGLTQEELVVLIEGIRATLEERNDGMGDFLDVRFYTHI